MIIGAINLAQVFNFKSLVQNSLPNWKSFFNGNTQAIINIVSTDAVHVPAADTFLDITVTS